MAQRKIIRRLFCCILILLLAGAFTLTSFANAAEPPGLTVIVAFPPDDLELSIRFTDGRVSDAVQLEKEQKMWESYYRFFYWMFRVSPSLSLEDATLIVQSSEKSFECPLPESTFGRYNNLLTLDVESESVVIGQSPVRSFLLIAIRVVLTLLIEGLIFFAFGYRKKASWATFAVTNLLTQGALNLTLVGPNLGSYWFLGYIFFEIIILVAELTVFALALKEFRKRRAIAYALTANMSSLILGGILISWLPV